MRKEQRLTLILQHINIYGSLQVNEIAKELNVSPMTIRRDLEELESRVMLKRTHGGAVAANATVTLDTTLAFRTSVNREAKERIARAAASTIHNGDCVFLSSGSTVTAFSAHLASIPGLTIVTDSVNVAYELSPNSYNKVIITGGEINLVTMTASGLLADRGFNSFNYHAAYIGVTAIDEQGQIYLGSLAELSIVQQALRLKCPVYILADSSKIGKTDFVKAGGLAENHILITNPDVPDAIISQLKSVHGNIIFSE